MVVNFADSIIENPSKYNGMEAITFAGIGQKLDLGNPENFIKRIFFTKTSALVSSWSFITFSTTPTPSF